MGISIAEQEGLELCQSCGVCCNGSLFPVMLVDPNEADNFTRIRINRGYHMVSQEGGCEKLEECGLCALADTRPRTCKTFKCNLLHELGEGEIELPLAKGIVKLMKAGSVDPDIVERFESKRPSHHGKQNKNL